MGVHAPAAAGADDGVDFFVSYTETDRGWAEWIAWQLEDAGYRVLLQAWDFGAGSHFVREMHRAATRAARTVAVMSAVYLTSAYGEAEWQAAWAADPSGADRRLLPVRVEDCPRPGLLGQLVGVDLFGLDQQAARQRLLDATAGGRDKPSTPPEFPRSGGRSGMPWFPGPGRVGEALWQPGRSPFPGLAAFDASLAGVFHGRDEDTRRLSGAVTGPGADGPGLLVVVGPSGCGKSSLVAAGLTPALAADPDWLVLPVLLPGSRPVSALAGVLAEAGRRQGLDWQTGPVENRLAAPDGMVELARELLGGAAPARRLLLVVDQAEELLVRASPDERAGFFAALGGVTGRLLRVVATVRSEYLDRLIEDATPTGLRVDTQVVQPLVRDLLPLVITGPARLAGLSIDDELVARMVADTGDGQGLPLLAYTLARLYTQAREADTGVLSAVLYEGIGGVQGALVDHANTALAEAAAATGRDGEQVLAVLLRLVTVDGEGRPVRRRFPLDQLPGPARGMLAPFVAHRLLAIGRDPAGGPVTLELTHERLLSVWSPLADAVRDRAAVLAEARRVEHAAAEWDSHGRDDGYLWPRPRIDTAVDILGSAAAEEPSAAHDIAAEGRADPGSMVEVNGHGRRFLSASTDHARQRARRERRQRRNRRSMMAAFAALAIVVPTALFLNASAETKQARRETAVLDLLARASATRNVNALQALRFALAAHAVAPDDAGRTNAESILLNMLTTPHPLDEPLTAQTDWVRSVVFSPDGKTLASSSDDGAVRLWDVADPARPAPLSGPLTGHTGPVTSVVFSPDGKTLASAGGTDGAVRLWDVADPARPTPLGGPLTGHTSPVMSVVFSPDGRTLASGSYDFTVRLWDVADPARPTPLGGPLTGHTSPVMSVVFSPDGRTLASGDLTEGTVRIWALGPLMTLRANVVSRACAQAGGLERAVWESLLPQISFRASCPS